jgi:hypothetical protein
MSRCQITSTTFYHSKRQLFPAPRKSHIPIRMLGTQTHHDQKVSTAQTHPKKGPGPRDFRTNQGQIITNRLLFLATCSFAPRSPAACCAPQSQSRVWAGVGNKRRKLSFLCLLRVHCHSHLSNGTRFVHSRTQRTELRRRDIFGPWIPALGEL